MRRRSSAKIAMPCGKPAPPHDTRPSSSAACAAARTHRAACAGRRSRPRGRRHLRFGRAVGTTLPKRCWWRANREPSRACWSPEMTFHLVDPSLVFHFEAQGRRRCFVRRGSRHGGRLGAQHSDRRTRGIEFRRTSQRHRHRDPRAGRGRFGHQGAHRLYAQDDARPARAGEIRGALRRRIQSPLRIG